MPQLDGSGLRLYHTDSPVDAVKVHVYISVDQQWSNTKDGETKKKSTPHFRRQTTEEPPTELPLDRWIPIPSRFRASVCGSNGGRGTYLDIVKATTISRSSTQKCT